MSERKVTVRWGGMVRGAGTSKSGFEYHSRDGVDLFIPGDRIADELELTIRPSKTKREKKLEAITDWTCKAGKVSELMYSCDLLEMLEAIDREDP